MKLWTSKTEKKVLGTYLVLLVLFIGFLFVRNIHDDATKMDQTQVVNKPLAIKAPSRTELLKLVNAERAKNKVAPLVEDPRLDQSAQFKAEDMDKRKYFAHEDPKTGKNNGLDRLNAIDDSCTWVSENLHYGEGYYGTSEGIVSGWISSKPHHVAMIDPRYKYTGFGTSGIYTVEHFCVPK